VKTPLGLKNSDGHCNYISKIINYRLWWKLKLHPQDLIPFNGMKEAGRKHPDRLADSCKRLSVNWMAAGSRLCPRDQPLSCKAYNK